MNAHASHCRNVRAYISHGACLCHLRAEVGGNPFRRRAADQEELLRAGAAGTHQGDERSQAGTAQGLTADSG